MRMVSQARGNESVRRVMQESTVTIEEVEEDEVVDLIGMFNSYATSSRLRMVKEVRKRLASRELIRKKMMKLVRKECRRSISERVYYSTRRSAQEHSSNGVDMKTKK